MTFPQSWLMWAGEPGASLLWHCSCEAHSNLLEGMCFWCCSERERDLPELPSRGATGARMAQPEEQAWSSSSHVAFFGGGRRWTQGHSQELGGPPSEGGGALS